jgi:hypothetical protein
MGSDLPDFRNDLLRSTSRPPPPLDPCQNYGDLDRSMSPKSQSSTCTDPVPDDLQALTSLDVISPLPLN